MANNKQLLGVTTFHVRPGKEKDFLKLLQEGPFQLCEKMGGLELSIYFRAQSNDYVATAHWNDTKAVDQYLNCKELKAWQNKATPMLRDAPTKELYEIVQERTA